MGGIIFKITLIVLLVAFLVFMWRGDRRNRLAREAEERAALEDEKRRRRGDSGAGGS
ncbi:MAG: hypothetical protein RBT81_08610 [Gammaproteobacteria bacterium]|jgi:cbb3-type cytochrome oxidase subunit 3|nr:hypothetical protein [Gammaproteobacteria bacterium]